MASAQLLVIGLLLMVIVVAAKKDHTNDEEYLDYKKKHKKNNYGQTDDEKAQRYRNFCKQRDYIANYDRNAPFTMQLNEMATYHESEYKQRLGYVMGATKNARTYKAATQSSQPAVPTLSILPTLVIPNINLAGRSSSPATVDLRKYSNPVKDQGQCGSCWAFAASETVSMRYIMAGYVKNGSIQDLMDCSWANGNMGCQGGYMQGAYQYMITNQGFNSEDTYHYVAKDSLPLAEACRSNRSETGMMKPTEYYNVNRNENDLMQAFVQQGPVAVAIHAGHAAFMNYNGGIFDVTTCNASTPDHAVTLVGYGTTNTTPKYNYWILKNSWGIGWGEDGYMRMVRGKNMCGVGWYGTFPFIASYN